MEEIALVDFLIRATWACCSDARSFGRGRVGLDLVVSPLLSL